MRERMTPGYKIAFQSIIQTPLSPWKWRYLIKAILSRVNNKCLIFAEVLN